MLSVFVASSRLIETAEAEANMTGPDQSPQAPIGDGTHHSIGLVPIISYTLRSSSDI